MVKTPVYLDYHATTPVDPRVVQAMLPYFTERFGNPSSRTHRFGQDAAAAVDRARSQVARLVGARAAEIVFTSGATESNNLAIKGVVAGGRGRSDHVVTVVTEHHAVLDVCRQLERDGLRVTYLPVRRDGLVDLDRVREAVGPGTLLVSVMTANNEIGVVQPVAEIARLAHECGALVHTDAAQAAGKIPVDVGTLGVDLLSFTAHKMYGPKGVGALYVRRGVRLAPLIDGGGQERGLRPGTLNVPGIVGFGEAAELCRAEVATEGERLRRLRDRLLAGVRDRVGDVVVNGSLEARLPHNLNVSFPGVEGESLLLALGDLALSTGAACASGTTAPSHVLTALGLPEALARASLRFGLGRWTTEEEIDYAVERLATVVSKLGPRGRRAG